MQTKTQNLQKPYACNHCCNQTNCITQTMQNQNAKIKTYNVYYGKHILGYNTHFSVQAQNQKQARAMAIAIAQNPGGNYYNNANMHVTTRQYCW